MWQYEVRFGEGNDPKFFYEVTPKPGDCEGTVLTSEQVRRDLLGIEWINGKAFSRMLNKVREP